MSLSEFVIDKGYFTDIKNHIIHNYKIAEFYENLYSETHYESYLNKSKNVDLCFKYIDVDYYRFQSVKDIKRVNLCRDKFCFNCQSMLSIKRQGRFAPQLDIHSKEYKVCHMIVTVPNCEPEELKPMLDKMYIKFPFLMRYFRGKAKVSGIDFKKFGYGGAVRGLEVTYNNITGEYHPHFHCMVLFRQDLDFTLKHRNSFSYSYGVFERDFSDLEILIQKIWYLLMNDIRVTLSAIDGLNEGYSVKVEDSQGYYHECFKYAIKGAFDPSQGSYIYKETVFRVLQEALNNRRMVQGYGLLHNFNDLDGEILEAEVVEEYLKLISELRAVEIPDFYVESLDELIERSKTCKYISKSNLKRLIMERKRMEENE